MKAEIPSSVSSSVSSSSPPGRVCRICLEEEEEGESGAVMEAPCGCSGTAEFAHRDCVQRWCDEKGNAVCEICRRRFEPGYVVAKKKALVEVGVTIRESLEVPRRNYVVSRARDGEGAEHGGGCLPGSARGASFCRHLAMTLTAILLVREFISVMTEESDNDVFNPFTIFVLRASGILLPVYVIMSTINSVQFSRRQQILLQHLHERNGGSTEEDFLRHHVIQIQP
ncbi:RING/FYVE/PHD zinc finger superfamily protein isoform X3 [Wolffia australiana]